MQNTILSKHYKILGTNNIIMSTLFIKVNFLYLYQRKQRIDCVFFPNETVTSNFKFIIVSLFRYHPSHCVNSQWIITLVVKITSLSFFSKFANAQCFVLLNLFYYLVRMMYIILVLLILIFNMATFINWFFNK